MKRIKHDLDLNKIKISRKIIKKDSFIKANEFSHYFLLLIPYSPLISRSMDVPAETM